MNAIQEREDLELGGNTLKLTVKPDKKDWNAEKPAKQQTASSIAKNKVQTSSKYSRWRRIIFQARLVVRNLSFKADEDTLQNLFSKHGQVSSGGRFWKNIDFSFAKVDFKGRANMYTIFQGGGCKHPEEGRRPHGGMCLC